MELKEANQPFQIKLLSEITECWCVWEKQQQRKDTVKEGILYLMNFNKENDVALFPEVNFVIWTSWPCGVLTYRASYAFHVGKWYHLQTEILAFSQIRNLSLTCCLSAMVKRHSKATQLPFLFSTGARMKTLIEGTLGRSPFQESWKQFLFDQQAHLEVKQVLGFFNAGNSW